MKTKLAITLMLSIASTTLNAYPAHAEAQPTLQENPGNEDNQRTKKELSFSSSDKNLEQTFNWGKKMALSYAHDNNDPVGYWYEAALPGRQAFCMRDASHQSIAAEIVGLSKHNFNMMEKFAENISEPKDWCTHWEIDKNNVSCSADYVDDANFWYNLNANFDVLFACWRLYEWTGDKRYLTNEKMVKFFRLSVNEYVERWKLQPENMLLRTQEMNIKETTQERYREVRGLPSYVENYPGLTNSSDLIASIYAGFEAYSNMLATLGQKTESKKYHLMAEEYRQHLEKDWWNNSINAYHTFWTKDNKFADGEGLTFMLWFNAVQQPERIRGTIDKMMARKDWNIENVSYFPVLWYRYNRVAEAYEILKNIITTQRSEYPEVSYGMMEGLISGTMGIIPSASQKKVTTLPKITGDHYLQVDNLPLLQGFVTIRHNSNKSTRFINNTPQSLTWQAAYMGDSKQIIVNGKRKSALKRTDLMGNTISYIEIKVPAGGKAEAEMR